MNIRKYWIRKDREESFLFGVIAVCIVAGFVTPRWSRADRMSVRPEIKMQFEKLSKERQKTLLKEVPISQSKKDDKKYYRVGEETTPVVPKLIEDPNETKKKSKKRQ